MLSSIDLKKIVAEARPIIERQLDDAELISGLRDVVAESGGDWSALKALIKAQIQDERDETGNGKRVQKILDKADFAMGYAGMLGWAKMNENIFSAGTDHDPITGEVHEPSAKLIATVATGLQTKIGRNAIMTALDIMIEREEAEEETGAAISRPDMPFEVRPEIENRPDQESSEAEDSGEMQDEHAIHLPANSPETAQASGADTDPGETAAEGICEAVTVGGDESGTVVNPEKPRKPLRPHCLNPGKDTCGGYGSTHCAACLKASREKEIA